jgi:hypothetical protein
MKIIISEDRIYDLIMKHINTMFDVENIHWTYGTDEEGDEVDYAMLFYMGDYGDDEDLFKWYGEDYFYSEEMRYRNKEMIKKWKKDSPMLEFDNNGKKDQLDNLFGNKWHQPFKDWFQKNFNVPVKTID